VIEAEKFPARSNSGNFAEWESLFFRLTELEKPDIAEPQTLLG